MQNKRPWLIAAAVGIVGVLVAGGIALALSGGGDSGSNNQAAAVTASPSATASATGTTMATATAASASVTSVPSTATSAPASSTSAPAATETPVLPPCCKPTVDPSANPPVDAGRQKVEAPIQSASVTSTAISPGLYVLQVTAGLPNGCAKADGGYTVEYNGTAVTVKVYNTMPSPQNVACTQVYGMYDKSIGLVGPFTSGTTYTVSVNGYSTSFTAQ